ENGNGGGLYLLASSPQIISCEIRGNTAYSSIGAADGGGIVIFNNSNPIIKNCQIVENKAQNSVGTFSYGGGLYCENAGPTIQNCTSTNNKVSTTSGNAYGGGFYSRDNATPTIIDTISWGNTATNGNEIYVDSGSGEVTITYCDVGSDTNDIVDAGNHINSSKVIKGFVPGEYGNISANPRFVVGPKGAHYLEKDGVADGDTDSPCIDAGSANANTFNYLDGTTTCVDNREDIGTVDMGFHYPNDATVEIYVDDENGSDSTGDGSEQNPYKTIQKGIDVAGDGDIVWVEEGRYKGDGNRDLDMHGKAVRVKGVTGDPDDVIIDCEGTSTNPHRGFYFHSGETLASQIHSLTICHGYAKNEYYGNNLIVGGGGLCCSNYSNPIINNCIIRNNIAKSTTILAFGGGIYCNNSNPKILGCKISSNVVSSTASWSRGGGISLYSSSPLIQNCEIINNSAEDQSCGGGGISIDVNSNALVNNCLIANNIAKTSTYGAGGGGVWIATDPTFTNCTITNNFVSGRNESRGGGIFCGDGYPVLINSIVWGNNSVSNEGHEIYFDPPRIGTVYFDHSCVGNDPNDRAGAANKIDLTTYGGNISSSPQFAIGPNGNYYLGVGSQCINGGSGQATDYPYLTGRTTNINGSADIGLVDMGYHYHDTAQSAYAIGWIGGGSNGWKTTNGVSASSMYQSFDSPGSVCVDSSGNITVSEYENHRINKWDSNGNALGWIGDGQDGWNKLNSKPANSNQPKYFLYPYGHCIDSNGNIYVADQGNYRVCKWDSAGIFVGWIGGGYDGWQTINSGASSGSSIKHFNTPTGVYVDSDGFIYVSDQNNNRISKWNSNGIAVGWIGGGNDGWQPSGTATSGQSYKKFYIPVGICGDASGNLFIADQWNNRICKWNSNGIAIGWIGDGCSGWQTKDVTRSGFLNGGTDYRSFKNPYGVFVYSNGIIYVADTKNHRVSKWDSAGNSLGWIGGGSNCWQYGNAPSGANDFQSFNAVRDICVDSSGYIFISDNRNHRISKWKEKSVN
ncbi:MAG: right-handed parallel beta-helix repeat-containing protein, partial [Planctomycetes bacterium]|nr:right-handed parallel beta-helix repeat-containing protein [Planctomycetota bacterium]